MTKPGNCFKGCFAYYLFDKGAPTQERIAWSMAHNVVDRGPETWRIMAYTESCADELKRMSGQKKTGRKLQKPVFVYSLAWSPEQDPDREHMEEIAMRSLACLGLFEYEVMVVAHQDTEHPHLHVIVNRVHPVTGLAADTSQAVALLQKFASDYERETVIYCQQREVNRSRRELGERVRYGDEVIQEAWEESDCGRSFATALQAKGYVLSRGRKRLVVVDSYGKAHNPLRHLKEVRASMFQEKLQDLDFEKLPSSQEVQALMKAKMKNRYNSSLLQQVAVGERSRPKSVPFFGAEDFTGTGPVLE